jgi:transposase InsO family protein
MKQRHEEKRHLALVFDVIALPRKESEARTKGFRGYERQRSRRELEAAVRDRVCSLSLRLRHQNHSFTDVADRFDLGRSTLSQWCDLWIRGRLQAVPRGRPVNPLGTLRSEALKNSLELHGPSIGVNTLKALFPEVPRALLWSYLKTFRWEWSRTHRKSIRAMHFLKPGRIWAMDFTEPDLPMEGPFTQILTVRDLASRRNLLSLPLERATGLAVFGALRALFSKHGPPLVIKIDNAKAFDVPELDSLLWTAGVLYLKSPPYTPGYNGACEWGNGTLKHLAHHEAAKNDHPEYWTGDDIENARRRANLYARPEGLDGPNADEVFARRSRITPEEREAFINSTLLQWAKILDEEQKQRTKRRNPSLNKIELADIVRNAIQSALLETGNLEIRRRRVSPVYSKRVPS